MKNNKGKKSEDLVEDYLRGLGFEILKRNYRKSFGEVDIIAKNYRGIWFFEVKTENERFPAIERIDKRKMNRILRVANAFMEENSLNLDTILAIAIVDGSSVEIVEVDGL